MLNRRSLRIKAMQALYAFDKSKGANYHMAIDQIKRDFAPDLNSMEVQDKELLEKRKRAATKLFSENFNREVIEAGEDTSEEVRKSTADAVKYYHKMVDKDFQYFRKLLITEAEKIADQYVSLLLLLIEMAEQVKLEDDERKRSPLRQVQPTFKSDLNFYNNQVIQALRTGKELEIRAIKRNVSWEDNKDQVWEWYRDVLKKDDTYRAYRDKAEPTFEDDKNIVLHIIKKLYFQNDAIRSYLEENDLSWVEDKSVLRSMLVKTIKGIEPEHQNEDEDFELMELSMNWDDDREFLEDLFRLTVVHDKEYEDIVAKRTRKWDMSRIALTDRIILKMAVAELINFPGIPVKVTINEYIELSKNYSTPKSKQFVNGVLDAMAEALQNEGVIRKSGRGLIDNK